MSINNSELELAGALFGVAGVWLTVKEKVWCFPVGLVNVIITAYLVMRVRLYADALQQVMYFILLIAGWISWSKKSQGSILKISFLTAKERGLTFIAIFSGTALLIFFFRSYTHASLPFWDSAGTMLSFTAQYLIARKKIENWLLWMVVNVLYIFIFWVKGMPFYSALSLVYFIQAVFGWKHWQAVLHQHENKKQVQ